MWLHHNGGKKYCHGQSNIGVQWTGRKEKRKEKQKVRSEGRGTNSAIFYCRRPMVLNNKGKYIDTDRLKQVKKAN